MVLLRTLQRLIPAFLLATLTGAVTISFTAPVYAKKSGLSPAKIKQINKSRKSFEACRKDVIDQLKDGTINKKKFEVALGSCKENFPGADLYITCKKQAIQAASAKNVAASQAIEQCKRYLIATTFDPDVPVPFFTEGGQLYFASVGLNRSLPISALAPPNFNCDKLQAATRNLTQAQYFLFGNHPNTFAGTGDLKGDALMELLKMSKPSVTGVDIVDFGRVFNDPRAASGMVYFPTGACDFEAEPGDLLSGLSAYYLIDHGANSVTPYFGIAYYKQDQRRVTTAKLIQALLRTLGPTYKGTPKNDYVTFIAAANLTEVDDEQDPKNLCKQPRQHRFVGIVQGHKDKPNKPEYLILANVKNLCDFGDRLAKRLVQ